MLIMYYCEAETPLTRDARRVIIPIPPTRRFDPPAGSRPPAGTNTQEVLMRRFTSPSRRSRAWPRASSPSKTCRRSTAVQSSSQAGPGRHHSRVVHRHGIGARRAALQPSRHPGRSAPPPDPPAPPADPRSRLNPEPAQTDRVGVQDQRRPGVPVGCTTCGSSASGASATAAVHRKRSEIEEKSPTTTSSRPNGLRSTP